MKIKLEGLDVGSRFHVSLKDCIYDWAIEDTMGWLYRNGMVITREPKEEQEWYRDRETILPPGEYKFQRVVGTGAYELGQSILENVPDHSEWMTREGTLPKRIAKYIKSAYNIKLTDATLGTLGEKLARSRTNNCEVYADTTDEIHWRDGDFGDGGSCFWNEGNTQDDRAAAKDLIHDHGFAVRLYTDDSYENGRARCWCIPQDGILYIFNAYGNNHEQIEFFVQILLKLLPGYTTRKVQLDNCGNKYSLLYINSGMGYALAPMGVDIPSSHDFEIDQDDYDYCHGEICYICDDRVDEDDSYSDPDGNTICYSCYERRYFTCDECGSVCSQNDQVEVERKSSYNSYYHTVTICSDCASNLGYQECEHCGEWKTDCSEVEGDTLCPTCVENYVVTCEACEKELSDTISGLETPYSLGNHTYCEDCFDERKDGYCPRCDLSGVLDPDDTPYYINGQEVCLTCHQEYIRFSEGARQLYLEDQHVTEVLDEAGVSERDVL